MDFQSEAGDMVKSSMESMRLVKMQCDAMCIYNRSGGCLWAEHIDSGNCI